ncbi:hypothetical protein GCM10023321_32170 [Pseudonocardia eucalypti]|uniref:Uncharacterized protein n=1 Tax=Pseudonocardia eucalypti TaxID=648755 RepID=A0ABP9QAL6_9PSEU
MEAAPDPAAGAKAPEGCPPTKSNTATSSTAATATNTMTRPTRRVRLLRYTPTAPHDPAPGDRATPRTACSERFERLLTSRPRIALNAIKSARIKLQSNAHDCAQPVNQVTVS